MRKKIFITIVGFALLANVSAQVKVDALGRVGIGRSTPQYKLDIAGDIHLTVAGYKIGHALNETFVHDGKSMGHYAQMWANDSWATSGPTLWQSAYGGIKFFTAGALRMVIHNNGNVGIGKVNPQYKLDIAGDIQLTYTGNKIGYGLHETFVHDTKSMGHYAQMWINDSWTTSGPTLWQSAYGGIKFFTRGTMRMAIHNNGNVGIGTTNPAYKLDVAGDIATWGNLKISSDERLKTEIKPLTDEISRLYLLQGKSYKKTLQPTDFEKDSLVEKKEEIIESPEYGYLAQELKEIFPDLVSQDSAGYHAVNYIGLIPVIIEALKDQKLTIENLQKEIQERTTYPEESKTDELLQRVEALEKALTMCCNTNQLRSTETSFQQFELTNPADSNQETMILYQNAPNPFNENTTIQCYIPQTVNKVQLCVYDMQGVQQQCLPISERGTVIVQIQARQLTAGIYTYLLIGDDKASEAKQMILTK